MAPTIALPPPPLFSFFEKVECFVSPLHVSSLTFCPLFVELCCARPRPMMFILFDRSV